MRETVVGSGRQASNFKGSDLRWQSQLKRPYRYIKIPLFAIARWINRWLKQAADRSYVGKCQGETQATTSKITSHDTARKALETLCTVFLKDVLSGSQVNM